MKNIVQLDNKEVREIIANFLDIPIDNVIPNRYNFSIDGLTIEEVEERIKSNSAK